MCGLFGVFNSNASATKKIEDFVRDAFIASSVRGTDSTGMFNITGVKHDVMYQKLAVNGATFVEDKATKGMIEAADLKAITVGHCRRATQGAVNINNAHPFITDQDENGDFIIGVHNGSLTDWRSKPKANLFDVDSEWAMNHIHAKGLDAFKDFKGPYAMIWYDTRTPDVINVARNNDRTLYYQYFGENKDKDGNQLRTGTVILASEPGMLHWLATRNGLPIGGKCWIFEAGYHYTFNINDVTKFTKEKLPEPEVVKATTTTTYHNHYNREYSTDVRKKELNAKLKEIFSGVTKEEDKKSKLPLTLCTPDEIQRASFHKELGEIYEFVPVFWDATSHELVGEIVYNFGGNGGGDDIIENLPAVLRGMSAIDGMKASRGDFRKIEASVIGVTDAQEGHDIVYVMGMPKLILKALHNLPALVSPISATAH